MLWSEATHTPHVYKQNRNNLKIHYGIHALKNESGDSLASWNKVTKGREKVKGLYLATRILECIDEHKLPKVDNVITLYIIHV